MSEHKKLTLAEEVASAVVDVLMTTYGLSSRDEPLVANIAQKVLDSRETVALGCAHCGYQDSDMSRKECIACTNPKRTVRYIIADGGEQ